MNDDLIYMSWNIPIRIAVIAETKEQAISYFEHMIGFNGIQCNAQKDNNIIYISPMMMVEYINQCYDNILGERYNYCYCTKDVYESEWYKKCIEPCAIRDVFCRIIDEPITEKKVN